MRTQFQSTPIFLNDEAGHAVQVVLRHVHGESYVNAPGLLEVAVLDLGGADLGVPFRLHMTNSGGRLAGDAPSVDPGHFITGGAPVGGAGSISQG